MSDIELDNLPQQHQQQQHVNIQYGAIQVLHNAKKGLQRCTFQRY